MGYLFLLVALFAGVSKGYCGKKTSGYTSGFHDAVLANVIRMILCTVFGLLLILITEGFGILNQTTDMLLISALSGVATAVLVLTWLLSVKKSAYMMLDIFLMLGVLIPIIASNIFFNEAIRLTQWVGIIVLFVAVVIMCSYNNTIKAKLTPSSFILLLICGVANGIADFSQKIFAQNIANGSTAVFNFYTYLFATFVLTVIFFLLPKSDKDQDKSNVKKIAGYIFLMAIFLFVNSYFKTLAAKYLDAVILYPLNQGCALILSALMASVLFKEKLTIKAVAGIIIAFIGLLIINLL